MERNFFLEHLFGNMVSGTDYCRCFQNTGQRVGEWLSLRKPSSILLAFKFFLITLRAEFLRLWSAALRGSCWASLHSGEGEMRSLRMTAFLREDYKSCHACLGHEMAGSLGRDANQGVIKVWLSFTSRLSGRREPSGTHAQKKEEVGYDWIFPLFGAMMCCQWVLPFLKTMELEPSGSNTVGFGLFFTFTGP